jgi:hypothetical protein
MQSVSGDCVALDAGVGRAVRNGGGSRNIRGD